MTIKKQKLTSKDGANSNGALLEAAKSVICDLEILVAKYREKGGVSDWQLQNLKKAIAQAERKGANHEN